MIIARLRMRPGLVYLIGAGLLWGTIGICGRMIFERSALDPFEISWLRTLFAMPVCLGLGLHQAGRRLFHVPRRDFAIIAILALTIFAYQALYLVGVREVGVSIATLICLCSIPIMVSLYSVVVQGERLSRAVTIALIGAVGGTALLTLGEGGSAGHGTLLLGIGAALLSALLASMFNISSQLFVQRYPPITALALGFPITLIVFSPVMRGGHLDAGLPLSVWALLLYLGVGTQGVAYFLFQWGMQSESATIASIVSLLEPVVASMLAWVIFEEKLGTLGLVGAGMLVAGLVVLTMSPPGSRAPVFAADGNNGQE
ncbi:MAG TPA: EamA family transporter [Thermomicrobiales bacterium]|nr:EamA family transporter [Thermomicrobiales bacterium]